MDIKKYPWLHDFLPINITKCRHYQYEKMNGSQMSSKESADCKEYEKNLRIINDKDLP